MRPIHVLVLSAAVASTSCSRDDRGSRSPRPEEVPEAVAIPASTMTSGVAIGYLRTTFALPSFHITKSPITVTRYRQCMDAGACTQPNATSPACSTGKRMPERATFVMGTESADLPITCTTPKQAAEYCSWLAGRLPSAEEWMLAVRGRDVNRFSWGNDAATCARHPLGARTEATSTSYCCDRNCGESERFVVGHHQPGASSFGVEDVLLTRAELLSLATESGTAACAGRDGACIATGMEPGAIDGFARLTESAEGVQPTFGFRCAWSDQ